MADLESAEAEGTELQKEFAWILSLPPSAFASQEMLDWLRKDVGAATASDTDSELGLDLSSSCLDAASSPSQSNNISNSSSSVLLPDQVHPAAADQRPLLRRQRQRRLRRQPQRVPAAQGVRRRVEYPAICTRSCRRSQPTTWRTNNRCTIIIIIITNSDCCQKVRRSCHHDVSLSRGGCCCRLAAKRRTCTKTTDRTAILTPDSAR